MSNFVPYAQYEYHMELLPTNATSEELLELLNDLGGKGYRLLYIEPRNVDTLRAWFVKEL